MNADWDNAPSKHIGTLLLLNHKLQTAHPVTVQDALFPFLQESESVLSSSQADEWVLPAALWCKAPGHTDFAARTVQNDIPANCWKWQPQIGRAHV